MHISGNLVIQRRRRALRPSVDLLDDRCLLSAFSPAQLTQAYGLGAIAFATPDGMVTGDGSGDGKGLVEVKGDSHQEVKGDSHQIWRTQRVQANVASLQLFLRSSTGPNRAFEPQSLGRVRDPVRIAEGPTAIDAATQRRHFGFRLVSISRQAMRVHHRPKRELLG